MSATVGDKRDWLKRVLGVTSDGPSRDRVEDIMLGAPAPNRAAVHGRAGPQPQADPAVLANRRIERVLESDSSKHTGHKVWAEPTQGTITPERKDSVEQILAVRLDAGFLAREKKKNEVAAKALIGNEVVQQAHREWPAWTDDPKKHEAQIQEFIQTVLTVQGDAIGLKDRPTKMVFRKFAESAMTNGAYNANTGNIEIYLVHPDFNQFLNTLTHENTHAFQAKLVDDLETFAIAEDSEDYQAAMAFAMNRDHAYISPDLSKQFDEDQPDKAYEAQCSEAHAFTAGNEIAEEVFNQLNKQLPDAKREENARLTLDACIRLAEAQQQAAIEEEREDLDNYERDMMENAAKIEARQREIDEKRSAQAENARIEAERSRQREIDDAEMERINEEFAAIRGAMTNNDPEQELMASLGMDEDDVKAFEFFKEKYPGLTLQVYLELKAGQQQEG